MNVVIPAAGLGKRMRSFGPKALIPLNDETVLARQVRLIRNAYPKSKIVVVAGFESDRVKKACKELKRVCCRINEDFETCNVAYSISQGLKCISSREGALVVYGDLVFSEKVFENIDKRESCVVIDSCDSERRQGEVGVTVVDGQVTTFSFGLPWKWSQFAYLAPFEKGLFQEIANEPHRKRQYGYEILNEIIERGGRFKALMMPQGNLLAEIDTSKDIAHALQIAVRV